MVISPADAPGRIDAIEGLEQLGTACAKQARDADDLALVDFERDILEPSPPDDRRFEAETVDLDHDIAELDDRLGVQVGQGAPDHAVDQRVLVPLGRGPTVDVLAVAQDRDLVGDLEDLTQLVGDVDDRVVLGLEPRDDLEEVGDLGLVERGRRFVEDQQLRVQGEGLGDLDQLLLADAQVLDGALGRDVEVEPVEIGARSRLHRGLIQRPQLGVKLPSEVDVLGDVQLWDQLELLVDEGDAGTLRIARIMEAEPVVVEEHLTLVVGPDATEDLAQRRLAGSVLADQAMHRSGLDRQREVSGAPARPGMTSIPIGTQARIPSTPFLPAPARLLPTGDAKAAIHRRYGRSPMRDHPLDPRPE